MWFKCHTCQQLKEENAYLKTLVDNLLKKSGVEPVSIEEESVPEDTEQEQKERALAEKGAQRYGE